MKQELAKDLRDRVADFYERHGAGFSRTRGMVWAEEKIVANLITPGMTVVDVGAGNGRFARLVPDGAVYIGIEPSEALRTSSDGRMNNPPLRAGGFPSLPIEDRVADVTVCFAVFHHLPTEEDRRAAVDELIRITKPGGIIAATTWHVPIDHPRLSPIEDGDTGDFFMSWKAEGADAKRYVHLFTDDEWAALWNRPDLTVDRVGLFGREDWTDDEQDARNRMVICRRV